MTYTSTELKSLSNAQLPGLDSTVIARINELGIHRKLFKRTRRGFRGGRNRKCQSTTTNNHNRNGQLTCALVNFRSVCNKIDRPIDHIVDCNLDIVFITESWLSDDDSEIRNHLEKYGFKIIHAPRAAGRSGGGVAIVYNNSVKVTRVPGPREKPPADIDFLEAEIVLIPRKCVSCCIIDHNVTLQNAILLPRFWSSYLRHYPVTPMSTISSYLET